MSARISFLKNPDPCNHLSDYKLRYGTDGYKSFQNLFRCFKDGRIKIKLQGTQIPRCSYCSVHHTRLYICLICRSISCSSHILSHTQSNKGHDISIDIERSELYCSSCIDQVYDPEFDEAVVSKQLVGLGMSVKTGADVVAVRSNKKRRLDSQLQFLVSPRDRREKWLFPLGLRGLNNLGSTCFMNAVLQALVHAPPLRNFWLSGQHNRDLCPRRSMGLLCLPCDLDVIFSAMFSGDRTPYSPAHLLYSWWQHSTNLATYEQQDSHEFFISLLDCIHESEGKSKCLYKDHEECQCITHRAFSGLLRSDVTCTTCGSTSTTYDPFIDISLTLDAAKGLSHCKKNKNSGEPSLNAPMPTLSGCLDLFTRSEKLGPDQKLNCQRCGEKKESSKQMSIRKLPQLLCLHIKRFEHSLTRKTSRKIDSYLQYPFRLNMSPYLSSSIIGKRFGNRVFAFDGDRDYEGSSSSAEFELFAVVTHSGMLASGHYVTYLRLKGLWYRCDDAWINEVEEEVVRGCECYMLFYAQERVIQKAHKELSYQVISMAADAFPFADGC